MSFVELVELWHVEWAAPTHLAAAELWTIVCQSTTGTAAATSAATPGPKAVFRHPALDGVRPLDLNLGLASRTAPVESFCCSKS